VNLDDLKKMNTFQPFEDFIRQFILEDDPLFRMIYFPTSNPLDENQYPNEENPYRIFEASESNEHGVILFGRKNDEILNTSSICVMIDFEQMQKGSLQEYNTVYILIRTILKGDVQKLENDLDRAFIIDKFIENNLDRSNLTGLGEIKKTSFKALPLNEQNSGYLSMYKGTVFSSDFINNKNIQKRIFGGGDS
jgi:hypothetical protein